MASQDIIHIPGVLENILLYTETPKYKLLDWIDEKKLNWLLLSSNPAAIDLLKDNINKINWTYLSSNPAAIDLLTNNLNKINWKNLSSNPAAIKLLHLCTFKTPN